MTLDPETIAVYDSQSGEYARVTANCAQDPLLGLFIAALPLGGRVLDLGCGPGLTAAEMVRRGLHVDATDGSGAMVALAAQQPGVTAWQASFDDIAGTAHYDGIWANFSLLHAPRANMARHLAALKTALKPGGLFHIALKSGTGEKRDKLGRLYTYYTQEELTGLLAAAGFTVTDYATGSDIGLDGAMADWVALTAHG